MHALGSSFQFRRQLPALSEVEWGLHEETKVLLLYLRSSRYGALEGLR